MPEATEQLITNTATETRINTDAVPNQAAPELNDIQKAFNQYYEGNEQMKQFAQNDNPFKAVADKLAEPPKVEGLKLLTEQSTPEEISAFKKALGAFEKADEYKYELPTSDDEAIKKLLPADQPFIKAFQELAQKSHMPESTWKELIGAYNQMVVEGVKTQVELSGKAMTAIKENWAKAHGEAAPKVESVFQKYFSQASAAESEILSTLSQDQLAAVGSVVYKQEKRLGAEDTIDTGNLGSGTLTDVEYVAERSKLLAEQRKLQNDGRAWSPEAEDLKKKLQQLSDRFKNSARA